MKYAFLTIIFLITILAVPESVFASGTSSPWVEESIRLVNEERVSRGIPELSVNERLVEAASAKLRDMEKKNYFAHTSPENRTPWVFVEDAGYDYRFAGENLAIHFKDPKREHDAWMRSEKHCQNILDPRFQEIGMAVGKVFFEGRETMLVVSMFGTKAESEIDAVASKEAALSMCRGNDDKSMLSRQLSERESEDGLLALLIKPAQNGPFGFAEIFAMAMFAFAQVASIILVSDVVLSRERREGLFVS